MKNHFIIASLIFSLAISYVWGHAAMVYPPPRNRIDSDTAPWSSDVPFPFRSDPVTSDIGYWCPIPGNGPKSLSGSNGQACFWFSNGCSIGCPNCDGETRGPIPSQPGWNHKTDTCGLKFNATICDPKLRTVNTGAECGAEDDYYFYSPWRAPGSSPVLDSCGMAGGTKAKGGFGAQYKTTPNAKQGSLICCTVF